jgi:hypothetical protein
MTGTVTLLLGSCSRAGYDWLVASTTTRWEVVGLNPVVGQGWGLPAKLASKNPSRGPFGS